MPYDEELAERVRDVLPDLEVTEQRMFGGLVFLVRRNMAVGVSREGNLLLRCDPAETDRHVSEPGATRMVMRGRAMDGWLRVSADAVADDPSLTRWVAVGTSYAASLPPKPPR